MASERQRNLGAVRPNVGLTVAYQAKLDKLIDEMNASITYWLKSAYRQNPPEMAQDALAAYELRAVMRRLAYRWRRKFNKAAPELAAYFATEISKRTDGQLKAALKKAGISVEFNPTPEQRDIIAAVSAESTSLIKSIPTEYLAGVEQLVMRSVTTGRDLHTLSEGLQQRYGVTKRRAALIARTTNNQATAALHRERQIELGLESVWLHSAGGKEPRPSHVANSGKSYDPKTGWFDPDAKEWIWPGSLINCFPGHTKVASISGPIRIWRTFFNGPMVNIRVGVDLVDGTVNHPILTARGWVNLGDVENGDQVVCMVKDSVGIVDDDKNQKVTTFEELFVSGHSRFGKVSRKSAGFDFHGHVPENDVDEIVFIEHDLASNIEPSSAQNVCNFDLTEPHPIMEVAVFSGSRDVTHPDFSSLSDISLSGFGGIPLGSLKAGVASRPHSVMTNENISNVSGATSGKSKPFGNGGGSKSFGIKSQNIVRHSIPVSPSCVDDTQSPELFAQLVRIAANSDCRVFKCGSRFYEFRSASDKSIRDFSGHVFTMETKEGYYSVGDALIQAKNCRCVSVSRLPKLV